MQATRASRPDSSPTSRPSGSSIRSAESAVPVSLTPARRRVNAFTDTPMTWKNSADRRIRAALRARVAAPCRVQISQFGRPTHRYNKPELQDQQGLCRDEPSPRQPTVASCPPGWSGTLGKPDGGGIPRARAREMVSARIPIGRSWTVPLGVRFALARSWLPAWNPRHPGTAARLIGLEQRVGTAPGGRARRRAGRVA